MTWSIETHRKAYLHTYKAGQDVYIAWGAQNVYIAWGAPNWRDSPGQTCILLKLYQGIVCGCLLNKPSIWIRHLQASGTRDEIKSQTRDYTFFCGILLRFIIITECFITQGWITRSLGTWRAVYAERIKVRMEKGNEPKNAVFHTYHIYVQINREKSMQVHAVHACMHAWDAYRWSITDIQLTGKLSFIHTKHSINKCAIWLVNTTYYIINKTNLYITMTHELLHDNMLHYHFMCWARCITYLYWSCIQFTLSLLCSNACGLAVHMLQIALCMEAWDSGYLKRSCVQTK